MAPNMARNQGVELLKDLHLTTRELRNALKDSIEFAEVRGGPIGPNRRAFVDEIVLYPKKWAPLIGVNSWKHIKEEVKEEISNQIIVSCILIFYSTQSILQLDCDNSFLDCCL